MCATRLQDSMTSDGVWTSAIYAAPRHARGRAVDNRGTPVDRRGPPRVGKLFPYAARFSLTDARYCVVDSASPLHVDVSRLAAETHGKKGGSEDAVSDPSLEGRPVDRARTSRP